MKVYISGNCIASPNAIKETNFDKAKQKLVSLGFAETNIISAHDSMPPEIIDFKSQLYFRFTLLYQCDSIYMLSNWRESFESRHELTIAFQKGFKIYFEEI